MQQQAVKKDVSFNEISWRYGKKETLMAKYQKDRFTTDIKAIDKTFGGLPRVGLTTFWGPAGSGKSKMAKLIASKRENALYIVSESVIDAPDNCIIGNYTKYLPSHDKALNELIAAIEHFKPTLVVIDSITTFFSVTSKAVMEADIRQAAFKLHQNSEKYNMPIIALSEIRGSGDYVYPAGGMSISHACSLLVFFNSAVVETPWTAQKYKIKEGEKVYTINIQKDKEGVADQGREFIVNYLNGEVYLSKVEYERTK